MASKFVCQEKDESSTFTFNHFGLKVTHVTSAHSPMSRITHGPDLNIMMLGNRGENRHLVSITSVTLYSVIPILYQKRNKIPLSLVIIFEKKLVNICQIVALSSNAQAGIRLPEIIH